MAWKSVEYKRQYYRERMKRLRATSPEHKAQFDARRDRNKLRNANAANEIIQQRMATGCALCHEPHPVCLSFHHLDPTTKRFLVSQGKNNGYSVKTIVAEMDKCIIVCENCHRKIHNGRVMLLP